MTMRLRVAFKLHGEEADLARQIADTVKMPVDSIAKLALQRYMNSLIDRAMEEMEKQRQQAAPVATTEQEVSTP